MIRGPLAHGRCSACGRLVAVHAPSGSGAWGKPLRHKRRGRRQLRRMVIVDSRRYCEGSDIPVPPLDASPICEAG
jgi:hypothetical protein